MKKKKQEQVIPFALILVKNQWWAKAVMSQITRIKKNMDSKDYFDQIQRQADDHYLKISLNKLYEWLIELNKYVEEVKDFIVQFNKIADIKLLRNFSEHEIDYYKKIGNKQSEFINRDLNQSRIRCVIIDGTYFLGGTINIDLLYNLVKHIDETLTMQRFTAKIESIPVLDELMKLPTI